MSKIRSCRPYRLFGTRITALTSFNLQRTQWNERFVHNLNLSGPSSESEPMQRLALILILLFAAPVAAQETGEPAAGAANSQQYCAKFHAIADEDTSPEPTAPRFKDVANTSGMTTTALTVWLRLHTPTMPNIILEPNDPSNVVAYVLSLKD